MRRYLRFAWERIGDIGNAQFVWGLVPATITSGAMTWFTSIPLWLDFVIGLNTMFVIYIVMAIRIGLQMRGRRIALEADQVRSEESFEAGLARRRRENALNAHLELDAKMARFAAWSDLVAKMQTPADHGDKSKI